MRSAHVSAPPSWVKYSWIVREGGGQCCRVRGEDGGKKETGHISSMNVEYKQEYISSFPFNYKYVIVAWVIPFACISLD